MDLNNVIDDSSDPNYLLTKIESLQDQLIACKINCNEKDQIIQQLHNGPQNNYHVSMDAKDLEIMRLQEECIVANKHILILESKLNSSIIENSEISSFKREDSEKEIDALSKNLSLYQLQLKESQETLSNFRLMLKQEKENYQQIDDLLKAEKERCNKEVNNLYQQLQSKEQEIENLNLTMIDKDNLILEMKGKLSAQHQMLTNQSCISTSKQTIGDGRNMTELDRENDEKCRFMNELAAILGDTVQPQNLPQHIQHLISENNKCKKRVEELEKSSIVLADKLTNTISSNNKLRQQLDRLEEDKDIPNNEMKSCLNEIMNQLCIVNEYSENNLHFALPLIISQIKQLTKKSISRIDETDKSNILQQEKQLKACKQQLQQTKEELFSMQEQLSSARDKLSSKEDKTEEDDVVMKNKKLMKLVRKYKIELDALNRWKTEAENKHQIEMKECKRQLNIANNKIHQNKTGDAPSYRTTHALERKVESKDEGLKEAARRLVEVEEALSASRTEVCELRKRWEDASITLTEELNNCKAVIEELTEREQRLLDFRLTVARMLGQDISKSTIADHVILHSLEQLIYSTNQKCGTTTSHKSANKTNLNKLRSTSSQRSMSAQGRSQNVDMKIY